MKIMKKSISVLLVIGIVLLSFTYLRKEATNPNNYLDVIEVLDEKKMTAMELTSGIVVVSTVVAAFPGDATNALSDQLTDLSNVMLLVTSIIYFEKFLLTTLGNISFGMLIPIAAFFVIAWIISNEKKCLQFAFKVFVLAILLVKIIPTSTDLMLMMQDTYEASVENAFNCVEIIQNEKIPEEDDGWLSNMLNNVTDTVEEILEKAKTSLSVFVDAIAVMVITTCAIPILVVVIMAWFIKFLFGIDLELKVPKFIKYRKLEEIE